MWEEKLELLSKFDDRAKKLGSDLFSVNKKMYLMDGFSIAALNRSINIVDGFVVLAKANNFFTAISLIRLQIDTCLRYYLSFIVDDQEDYINYFNSGKDIKKYRSNRFKKQFTDSNIAELLDESFPGFLNLYKDSSSFLHFTNKNLHAIITIQDESITFRAGKYDFFNDKIKYLFVNSMFEVTNIFVILFEKWIENKAKYSKQLEIN